MKISVQLDNNQKDIEVLIKTSVMDDNVDSIIKKLSDEKPKIIFGFIDDKAKMLDENNIIRIYSANKKVYAITKEFEYTLKIPLYEVIERVDQNHFVRISNTEIVNLKQVVDVPHIKQILGIGGGK